MFSRFISRKTFLAAGVAGVAGAWRGRVEAARLTTEGSWPWVREWVSGGQIGRRLWVHVDCVSGVDYARAICPALYACGLGLPLNVSALGEAPQDSTLPARFLMTARFPCGHTLVLNVSPGAAARVTFRGDRGGIDIQDGQIRIEETGYETKASATEFLSGLREGTEPRPPMSSWLSHSFECSDLEGVGDRHFAQGAALVRLGTRALAQG